MSDIRALQPLRRIRHKRLPVMLSVLLVGGTFVVYAQPKARTGQALNYGGDEGNTKYVPLDQITRDNVKNLRIVWRRPAVDGQLTTMFPDLDPSNSFQATPLPSGGMLYASNGVGLVEAFNPGTGKTVWVQEPPERSMRGVAGRMQRGVASWRTGQEQRLFSIQGEYLYALDATTGKPFSNFGENGRVNLHRSNQYAKRFSASSGPVVVADVVVVGGAGGGGGDFGVMKEAAPEDVRGYDVRTGRLLWTFHVVPGPGEFGNETWGKDSWQFMGAMGAWAPLSVDQELGYVYVPLSAPTNSWYGGDRPGQNLFSDSLVCLDAKTGKRVWHYQLVHHDLWDYDVASPPVLGTITVDGKRINVVIQLCKSGFVFVFDRATGQPVWPIEERAVPSSTTPGEQAWPTQPFPTKPPPFDRQGLTVDDLIDFTPALRTQALEITKPYVFGPLYTPPSVSTTNGTKGTLTLPGTAGAANWGSGAFDPETGMFYIASHTHPWLSDLIKPPPSTKATLAYVHGPEVEGSELKCCDQYQIYGPEGLPLVRPPYGRITAIDMNRGENVWVVPNGDGPRDHPLLKDLHLPPLGQSGRAAPLLTKTLLFAGEGDPVLVATPRGMGGKKFRAYDKRTGQVIWETELDAGTTGAPTSYMFQGKQYLVVAIGSKDHAAEFVALALP
jgi:glucose dehydrogenase